MGVQSYQRCRTFRKVMFGVLTLGVLASFGVLMNYNRKTFDMSRNRGPKLVESALAYSDLSLGRSLQIMAVTTGAFDASGQSMQNLIERESLTTTTSPAELWDQINADIVMPEQQIILSNDAEKYAPELFKVVKEKYWPYSEYNQAIETATVDLFETQAAQTNATHASAQAAHHMVQDSRYWNMLAVAAAAEKVTIAKDSDLEGLLTDVEDVKNESLVASGVTFGMLLLVGLGGCFSIMRNGDKEGEMSYVRTQRRARRFYFCSYLLCFLICTGIATMAPILADKKVNDFKKNELTVATAAATFPAVMNLLWSLGAQMALVQDGALANVLKGQSSFAKLSFLTRVDDMEEAPEEVRAAASKLLLQYTQLEAAVPSDSSLYDPAAMANLFRTSLDANIAEQREVVMKYREDSLKNVDDKIDSMQSLATAVFAATISVAVLGGLSLTVFVVKHLRS